MGPELHPPEAKLETITVDELDALAGRLIARAGLRLLVDQPLQQADLQLAARILRHLIRSAVIYTAIEVRAS
jgi:hypothetical protein